MDGASILAAQALDPQPGDDILDLCAAPGGKSLMLAEKIAEAGTLVANDRSASRRGRLKRVLESYIPNPVRERIRVTGHDATKWCVFETEAYDRILLDAPCSSERHVLHDDNASCGVSYLLLHRVPRISLWSGSESHPDLATGFNSPVTGPRH